MLLFQLFAVFNCTFNVVDIKHTFYIHSTVKQNLKRLLQKLQLLPVIYYSEESPTVDHCSPNQIAVIEMYFHCSLTAKVSSAVKRFFC